MVIIIFSSLLELSEDADCCVDVAASYVKNQEFKISIFSDKTTIIYLRVIQMGDGIFDVVLAVCYPHRLRFLLGFLLLLAISLDVPHFIVFLFFVLL